MAETCTRDPDQIMALIDAGHADHVDPVELLAAARHYRRQAMALQQKVDHAASSLIEIAVQASRLMRV